MNKENLLNYIGNTPLIKLVGFTTPNDATIYAKAEFLNVGGSIKTRASYAMIMGAIKSGKLKKGGRVVEVSSGNQGVGLALVGAIMGFKVTIIMPDSVTEIEDYTFAGCTSLASITIPDTTLPAGAISLLL